MRFNREDPTEFLHDEVPPDADTQEALPGIPTPEPAPVEPPLREGIFRCVTEGCDHEEWITMLPGDVEPHFHYFDAPVADDETLKVEVQHEIRFTLPKITRPKA